MRQSCSVLLFDLVWSKSSDSYFYYIVVHGMFNFCSTLQSLTEVLVQTRLQSCQTLTFLSRYSTFLDMLFANVIACLPFSNLHTCWIIPCLSLSIAKADKSIGSACCTILTHSPLDPTSSILASSLMVSPSFCCMCSNITHFFLNILERLFCLLSDNSQALRHTIATLFAVRKYHHRHQ